MLELVDVHTGYGRTEVIHGVNVEVPSDGVAAVMGHNGAGKTTLLRAAVGLLKCSKGTVRFDGQAIEGPSLDRAVIFQSHALLPWRICVGWQWRHLAALIETRIQPRQIRGER